MNSKQEDELTQWLSNKNYNFYVTTTFKNKLSDESIDKENWSKRNTGGTYTYDHSSSSGMTDIEFKNLTKERLVDMNKWTEEMRGYYFILK